MSITIANGYRVHLTSGGPVNPFEFASSSRTALFDTIKGEYGRKLLELATFGHDWLLTQQGVPPHYRELASQLVGNQTAGEITYAEEDKILTEKRNAIRWATRLLRAHLVAHRVRGTMRTEYNVDAELRLISDPSHPHALYVRMACHGEALPAALLGLGKGEGSRFRIEKYNYWNDTDKTEDGLTWEQWQQRGEVWRRLATTKVPSLQVPLIDVEFGYQQLGSNRELLPKSVPSLEDRARSLVASIDVKSDIKPIGDGVPENIYEIIQDMRQKKQAMIPTLMSELDALGEITVRELGTVGER